MTRIACLLALLAAPGTAAQFVSNPAVIPQGSPFNNSTTENVDFADVDLDGDWDAAFADGGDPGNDQDRLWMNLGGLQGGTLGVFGDETAARMPAISSQSRDVEFADLEGDGDVDLFVANTSSISFGPCRWYVNLGGEQGGSAGYFQDETASRWVGLGGPGSSVSPAYVLPTGGFVDWCSDGDFADVDNDGDLDLFQASYGKVFSGQVPSRLFLNDGDGRFFEHNPSGYQLAGTQIPNGAPAIWAEGVHQQETTSTDGSEADIASSGLDSDLGDIDGDFDLDLLFGGRDEDPRLFANRLEESGVFSFRDRTHALFPVNWASGGNNYEQEMSDLDGDGDLDILGLDWNGFHDVVLRNDGTGSFGDKTTLAGSGADDNEIDAVDYDNDGDLDLFIANFSGADKVYRNNGSTSGLFSFTKLAPVPGTSGRSLDADVCDTDGDGDYDLMTATDGFGANLFLENVTGTPDTTAPSIPRVETLPDQTAQEGEVPVRAHVYDNVPYYLTQANETQLRVEVDGVDLPPFPMEWSGGQVFRGELPANLLGNVTYRVESVDPYGNRGTSAIKSYVGLLPAGGQKPVTCGKATKGSQGDPEIESLVFPVQNGLICIVVKKVPPNTPMLIFWSTKKVEEGEEPEIGGAKVNLDFTAPSGLLADGSPDQEGNKLLCGMVAGLAQGAKIYVQAFALDGTAGLLSATKALEVEIP